MQKERSARRAGGEAGFEPCRTCRAGRGRGVGENVAKFVASYIDVINHRAEEVAPSDLIFSIFLNFLKTD